MVAGDEPRAVLIGREVLGNGGTAVDAAVAMYFAMAVTLPSRVSLGGGGVCVLFQGGEKRGHAIEFLARAAPSGGMVPSGMRAMAPCAGNSFWRRPNPWPDSATRSADPSNATWWPRPG